MAKPPEFPPKSGVCDEFNLVEIVFICVVFTFILILLTQACRILSSGFIKTEADLMEPCTACEPSASDIDCCNALICSAKYTIKEYMAMGVFFVLLAIATARFLWKMNGLEEDT